LNNLSYYFLLFVLPFIGVTLVTPIVAKIAYKNSVLDKPGLHKTHKSSTPLLGGVSIFFCFALVLFIFVPLDEKLLSLVLSTFILVATGLLDDLYCLKPIQKIIGQLAAASVVVLWNSYLFRFMADYFSRFFMPDFVVLMLIIGWVVLMVNAFNMIDGIDGLAAGTAAIIFLAMALLSYLEGGRPSVLGVQLIGAGACLGFLIFNFNPAKIFMGDTGSMLLGFILAASHLYAIKYPFSAQLVLGSMFIFAYPALDISYAIYRRSSNKQSIFKADKGHIHHVLMSLGFSVRKAVLIIYLANVVFAVLAILLLRLNLSSQLLLLIGICTATLVLFLFRSMIKMSINDDINNNY